MQLYKAGDTVTDTLSTLLYFFGHVSTSGNVSHLRAPFTTTGYQVTAGKTLYIAKFKVGSLSANAQSLKLGYADNDVGYDTATARTNAVMAVGVDDTNANGLVIVSQPTVSVPAEGLGHGFNYLWKLCAAQKFPFFRIVGTTPAHTVMFWGWEV